MKEKVTISVNDGLLKWVHKMIEKKEFASVSHAVQKALSLMKLKYESGKES